MTVAIGLRVEDLLPEHHLRPTVHVAERDGDERFAIGLWIGVPRLGFPARGPDQPFRRKNFLVDAALPELGAAAMIRDGVGCLKAYPPLTAGAHIGLDARRGKLLWPHPADGMTGIGEGFEHQGTRRTEDARDLEHEVIVRN